MIDLLLLLNVIDFYRQNKSRNSMHETNKHTNKFHVIMPKEKPTTRLFHQNKNDLKMEEEEQEEEESERIGLN
jgi:hypothetical protein